MHCTRRTFLKSLAATPCILGAPRALAADDVIPRLRKLAAGRPLIGVAVPNEFERHLSGAEKQLLATHFDSITPENALKWQNIAQVQGEYRFELVDEMVRFAEANRQAVVGHTLVFNRDGNFPDWILMDGDKHVDARVLWRRVEEFVGTVMTRYKGRIDSWDVLNEFVEEGKSGYRETGLTRVLGGDWPARLFQLAASIDPKAKLIYNDYGLELPERRKLVFAFVRKLQDQGYRIDVVGSQSHLEIDHKNIKERIDATIRDFATLGIRSAFTELDVDVIPRNLYWNPRTRSRAVEQNPYVDGCPPKILEQQAEIYRQVMQAVMANRKDVERVTFWGLSDRHSWLNSWPWERVNHGLLFDRDLNPKPAFHAVADELRRRGRESLP